MRTSAVRHLVTTLQVVHKRHWIPVVGMGTLAIVALGYVILGRIPVTIKGNAMFMTPGTVVPFQATASGHVRRWHVQVGDQVVKGQLLAQLDQPLIKKQLDLARQKLADLNHRNQIIDQQSETYLQLELAGLARKGATIEARIQSLQKEKRRMHRAVRAVYKKKQQFLAKQRKDLASLRRLAKKRHKAIKSKVELTDKLRKKGLRSEDEFLQVNRELLVQEGEVARIDLQIVQTTLDSAQASEVLLDSDNRVTETDKQIGDLEHEYQRLQSREIELNEEYQSALYIRKLEVSEVNRSIERLAKQLTQERELRAEYDGRIIELTRGEGERVDKGAIVGSIDTRAPSSPLSAVAYFKLTDGKKIEPGMTIRVTPAVVEQGRFGGIIGTVESVSRYPVTTAGAARTIGNTEASKTLTADGHFVEVYATLHTGDTPSGYDWEHLGGPDLLLSAGTLASARVDTKSMPPLYFIIPGLADI